MSGGAIVLFDGVCNLCNGSVHFIIDRDPAGAFRFAALQSEPGQRLLAKFRLPTSELRSLVLIEGGRASTRSTAALRIARRLSGGWRLGYVFILVPRFIRDAVYDFIAHHRYRWFGREDRCRVPSAELRSRFLEEEPVEAPRG